MIKKITIFGAALFLTGQAWAADQGSGTLSVAEPSQEFGRGPNVGVNPDLDPRCMDPVLACDTYSLRTDLPDDLVEFFPAAVFKVTLTSDGPDDYDLFVTDSEGNELANSGNLPGEAESVTLLAEPGEVDYGIEVLFYAVVGSTYSAAIDLDLGTPNPDKSAEEVAMWLADNGGAGARDAMLAGCGEPGVTLLTDPAGDNALVAVPVAGTDLLQLDVAQTTGPVDEPLLAFRLQLDDLSAPIPQSQYFVSFNTPVGVPRGVRAEFDDQGNAEFFTYVVSEDSDGERQGHFVDSRSPAHPLSNFTADGVITIYATPNAVGIDRPEDALQGFNAGSIVLVGAEEAGSLALNTDAMPDGYVRQGAFEYQDPADCAANEEAAARALGSNRGGGAFGAPLLLVMVSVLLLLRRRQRCA